MLPKPQDSCFKIQDVNGLIVEQGETLQRIDKDVEIAKESVHVGVEKLEEVHKYEHALESSQKLLQLGIECSVGKLQGFQIMRYLNATFQMLRKFIGMEHI